MAGAVSIKMVGDWRKEVGVPLRDALAVSMDICGRTGEQACKHAIILMAESARALARQAPKNRKVQQNPSVRGKGGQYVDVWNQGRQRPTRLYRLQFSKKAWESARVIGTWESARVIGNRGLAKRSWMWGLEKLGARTGGQRAPIRGASRVWTLSKTGVSGYIKENRLDYIQKAMPAGWESLVALAATNKIMAQARNKLDARWRRELGKPRRGKKEPPTDQAVLAEYFKGGF